MALVAPARRASAVSVRAAPVDLADPVVPARRASATTGRVAPVTPAAPVRRASTSGRAAVPVVRARRASAVSARVATPSAPTTRPVRPGPPSATTTRPVPRDRPSATRRPVGRGPSATSNPRAAVASSATSAPGRTSSAAVGPVPSVVSGRARPDRSATTPRTRRVPELRRPRPLPADPAAPGPAQPAGPGRTSGAPQAFQQSAPPAPPGFPQETNRPQQGGSPFGGGDDDWVISPPTPGSPGGPGGLGGPGGPGQGGYGYPQPGSTQAPPGRPAYQQQPTTWLATIGPDRDYFMAMMQRSGPEAAGLNLPAYSLSSSGS